MRNYGIESTAPVGSFTTSASRYAASSFRYRNDVCNLHHNFHRVSYRHHEHCPAITTMFTWQYCITSLHIQTDSAQVVVATDAGMP